METTITARLQLALDDIRHADAIALLDDVQQDIDIAEIGTPLLMRYGMEIVRDVKERFPHLDVLGDAKIMDAAGYEAEMAFDAGADYVTFLAVTDDLSVAECVRAAQARGRKVMADMICVTDLAARARTLEELGADVIAVHTGVDQQARGRTPLHDLEVLAHSVQHTALAVAGGIDRTTAAAYLALGPSILIVGSGITRSADPAAEAHALRQVIEGAAR
jgi:3-hexulose-6-phosphate synthase